MPRSLLRLLPLALATSCAAPALDLAPVEASRFFDARLTIQPASAGASAWAPPRPPAEVPTMIAVRARIFSVDPEALPSALGAPAEGVVAMALPGAEAARLEEALARSGLPLAVDLGVFEGTDGVYSLVDRAAYVSAYELVARSGSWMADPSIAVAQSGFEMVVSPSRRDDGAIELALTLVSCELDRPFAERELRLGEALAPMTIQTPTGISRLLRTNATLQPGETLLVGGGALPVGDSRNALLALVELTPLDEPRVAAVVPVD